ncbi:hypothetical protein CONPUDRAFT_144903 [Coniophora puteana RWD-64-598 SS2]|uniref:BHLH domain-containing protein n=1 Tax=Coniophora puteana (strain RWD-64-598) TaxID=741705 RepID=A0A5M3ML90_CONPW|nr:uncharacterized protein CONPUDRAFT_144903 [Coniophora puteana RWD-64-598 SS2]EIW79720.1 hypothetical protein CONPUDRAFT_144903 [Coniophora puteana RWD-64-598 SS2]
MSSSYRSIAPLGAHQSLSLAESSHNIVDSSADITLDMGDNDVYAASCNPPRRAKRLRSDSTLTATSAAASSATTAHVYAPPPGDNSPGSSDEEAEEVEAPPPPAPKRRGRKPGTQSRAVREAQRKINHSLIEKARRTKINDALQTLRELVPSKYKRQDEPPEEEESDYDDDNPKKKGKPKQEKEFKLEVLVRTVAYLQDLTERVNVLEQGTCTRCHGSMAVSVDAEADKRSGKRKRREEEEESDHDEADNERESGESRMVSRSTTKEPPTRLPSISSWLSPMLEPTSAAQSFPSPLITPGQKHVHRRPSPREQYAQLPSPPVSGTFKGTSSGFPAPPALTLPSPRAAFLSTTATSGARFSSSLAQPTAPHSGLSAYPPSATPSSSAHSGTSQHREKENKGSSASPSLSPVRTPDDETAASQLLRMSTSSSPPTLKKLLARREDRPSALREPHHQALTPGARSILTVAVIRLYALQVTSNKQCNISLLWLLCGPVRSGLTATETEAAPSEHRTVLFCSATIS